MKIFITLVIGCGLGWAANSFYAGFLYGKVQAETGGDLYTICEELLSSEDN